MSKFGLDVDLTWLEVANLLTKGDISGWFHSHDGGSNLQKFEKMFADFCGAKYAFAVSSGNAAIYVALRAVGVGRGDWVAVPAYTHVGSVAPIVLAGAKPLFVDVEPNGNMSSKSLRSALHTTHARANLGAILVVHQLGTPCDMDKINSESYYGLLYSKGAKRERQKEIFNQIHGLPIIEDASHALGSKYKGRKAGNLGDIGCFSIGGGRTKIIGTGEGGMITTNNDLFADRIKNIRNHGDRVTDVDYLCFDDETEILTEDGWKSFQDLDDEKVATLNEAGSIEYHKPSAYQAFQYNGKLLHWNGKRVDLKVTPEHNLYVANRYNSFKIRKAKEVFPLVADVRFLVASEGYNGNKLDFFEIPECGNYNNRTIGITKFPIIPWLKFLGWYLTEGCSIQNKTGYKISIAQDKKENIPEIVNCIKELGFHPWFSRWGTCVVFASKELCYYLKQFGYAYDRFIPKEVKRLSPELLRILVETMMKGDGNGVAYFTCSEQLADDFQEILSKIGYGSNKTLPKGRNTYYVTIAKEHLTTSVEKTRRSLIDYNGYVYDVTVPNHLILVRRNGKIMWSGNCFNFRLSELNALVGLIQMERVRELISWQVENAEYFIDNHPPYLEPYTIPLKIKTNRYLIGCKFSSRIAGMTRDEFLEKVKAAGFEGGKPRMNVGPGYSKLIQDIKFYSKWKRKLPMSEYVRDTSVWLDYHRFPRTKEEIDKLLDCFRGIVK